MGGDTPGLADEGVIVQRKQGSKPEHIRSILARLLSGLEKKMTPDFDPKLSGKIDWAILFLDSLNTKDGGKNESNRILS